MKKTKLVVMLLMGFVLLCGCMKVDINYTIDSDYTVTLEYHVQMDSAAMDADSKDGARRYLKTLVSKYESYGFEFEGEYEQADNSEEETPIDFTLTLTKPADSYEEAYEILERLLKDPDISFLLEVDMSTQFEEYEQAVKLYVETNLSRIVEATTLEDLPPSIRNAIEDGMADSEVNFNLTLPGVDVVEISNGTEVSEAKKKTTFNLPLSWTEASSMDLVIRIAVDNDKVVNSTMDESIQNTENKIGLYNGILYASIALGVLAIGGAIYFIIKGKKKEPQ